MREIVLDERNIERNRDSSVGSAYQESIMRKIGHNEHNVIAVTHTRFQSNDVISTTAESTQQH